VIAHLRPAPIPGRTAAIYRIASSSTADIVFRDLAALTCETATIMHTRTYCVGRSRARSKKDNLRDRR